MTAGRWRCHKILRGDPTCAVDRSCLCDPILELADSILAMLVTGSGGAREPARRFGGLVNLNVHFHLLVPDGVFTSSADGGLAFARLPAPTGTDLLAILDRVIRRIARRIADETEQRRPRPVGNAC